MYVCRHPELVAGLVLVSPAVVFFAQSSLSFMSNHASKLLSVFYMKTIFMLPHGPHGGPALHFVRREAHKRRERVSGGLGGMGACCCACAVVARVSRAVLMHCAAITPCAREQHITLNLGAAYI